MTTPALGSSSLTLRLLKPPTTASKLSQGERSNAWDMGFDMGGVFGKLSSSKIDISDFDFSSPVRKTTKTKERLGDYELHSSPRKKANENLLTTRQVASRSPGTNTDVKENDSADNILLGIQNRLPTIKRLHHEIRNAKKGGKFMGIDIVLVDEKDAVYNDPVMD
ncbi:Uncharacterized protein Rs2_45501 [Raphanus sativus]|nr:Uncharacterized protein Rs2_45501 [Raphanus sativus]